MLFSILFASLQVESIFLISIYHLTHICSTLYSSFAPPQHAEGKDDSLGRQNHFLTLEMKVLTGSCSRRQRILSPWTSD